MREDLQLTAIVGDAARRSVRRIPLHRSLQRELAELLGEQIEAFRADTREIPFDAGYKPDDDERFAQPDFELPPWLANVHRENAADLDPIDADTMAGDEIRGIVAFGQADTGEEMLAFQSFNRSHIVQPRRVLFFEGRLFHRREQPGLTLDRKLSAVYLPARSTLLFRSFRVVNRFLPLADLFREATEREIVEVLDHPLLAPEDAAGLAQGANAWFRKRFALLRSSDVLDTYSARQIEERAVGYQVNVRREGDRIVFPADRSEARRLLQFLNEELFRGAITRDLYVTNSKRGVEG